MALERLESELLEVIDASERQSSSTAGSDVVSVKQCLLPALTKPQCLDEAIDRLTYVLERHRLMFLYFAAAVRMNPRAIACATGIREQVRREEIRG